MPNPIHRRRFLRNATLSAGSMIFLPDFIKTAGFPGKTIYIVLPAEAAATETKAAELLSASLPLFGEGTVSTITESDYHKGAAFFLGRTKAAAKLGLPAANTVKDGYTLRKTGDRVIIAGNGSGLLYGVCDMLETTGLRVFGPDGVSTVKKPALASIPKETTMQPAIHYRSTSYGEWSKEYSDWHKLSSREEWGLFVHTFHTLVPPADYGDAHPEFYSLIKGVRQPATQLCLSNDAMFAVLTENLKKKIAEKPAAIYWSVSQNDNDQYCQCDKCRALNTEYGNVPSGSVLWFVNKVARAFPDKTISTLAYWYTRSAPKNIKAEPNVNIMLCNIESRRQAPVFETDPAFTKDVKDWGRIAGDILLWDYNIQFTNYFGPFPNLHTIGPNIRFYLENNVRALYMQSNKEPASEMALLRGYLISKLMWNPKRDDQEVIREFLDGYFGAAGAGVGEYIRKMREALQHDPFQLNIFGDPVDAKEQYLSAANMKAYGEIFDKAEQSVASDKQLLQRVQTARLPLLYAAIQIGRNEYDTPRSFCYSNPAGFPAVRPESMTLVKKFVGGCLAEKVKLVRERAGSPEHFQESYDRMFTLMEQNTRSLSYGKPVEGQTKPPETSHGLSALTDGRFGSYEAWQNTDKNFVFFTGTHADFVIDLGAVKSLQSVNMDFLNPQAQPDWHLMALPRFVSYALSEDGKTFGSELRVENPNNPDPRSNPEISKISIQSFQKELRGSTARFIRVHAENILTAPAWHIRAGQPMSIFTDQIVVL